VPGPSVYTYVGGDPVSHTDRFGLATDGKPLNSLNCDALKKIVEYENTNGKTNTIMAYNTLNFSDDMINLDAAYPSSGGPVSIDWMMKSAAFGAGSLPGISYISYGIQKSWWNIANASAPWKHLAGEANSNAPAALSYWLYTDGVSLSSMFQSALKKCDCSGGK